jgi:signal transduction histidine kinase
VLRTLYGKLAAALLALLLVVALVYVFLTLWSTRLYLQEANQRLHRDLAQGLVSEGLIGEGGQVGQAPLEEIFHTLMVVNPSIEVYLLDPDGELLAFSAPPGKVKSNRVSLGPVRQFLRDPDRIPVLGDDPRQPGRKTVFSTASVTAEGKVRGYLYIVLAGEPYETAFQIFRASHITRLTLGIAAVALAIVFLAGLFYFNLLTRRLRRLSSAVESFHRVEPSAPSGAVHGDEIERLSVSFREMADRIRDQMNRLRQVDTERRELVGNISHDLRTPLSSMQGHLETLLMKDEALSPEDRRHYLEVAVGSSRRLAKLVDELFELAKLDAPETRLHPEPFHLPELAQDVAQKFQMDLDGKRLEVGVKLSDDVPFVHADVGLVERALENLLRNAIQHSPEGSSITLAFRRSEPGEVETWVSDAGPGIAAEDLPHIFERFYRARKTDAPRRDGHGLGLAIVKRIVELHGGTVRARNEHGGGATFRFTLPAHGETAAV